jgi:hypothetical protein
MPNRSRRLFRLALLAVVTAGFLWLFQRQADFRTVLPALVELPAWSLFASIAALLANLGFVALRWRVLLAASGVPVRAGRLFVTECRRGRQQRPARPCRRPRPHREHPCRRGRARFPPRRNALRGATPRRARLGRLAAGRSAPAWDRRPPPARGDRPLGRKRARRAPRRGGGRQTGTTNSMLKKPPSNPSAATIRRATSESSS